MTSYKIHSIKDSEKLSFIVEWESEASITQKLSGEGHIILSVEKIEVPTSNLFCFEGKKADGWFVDGKISSEDIFLAYEMLTQEYKYILTKLYPEAITESKKQEKIFSELKLSFQWNTVQKPQKNLETSQQQLIKYKKILQRTTEVLQKNKIPEGDTIIAELKKLEQNNNITAIQQGIKETLKKLSQKRENKEFFTQLKPILQDMNIFVPPDIYFSFLDKFKSFVNSIDPLVHPANVQKQKIILTKDATETEIQKEYESIHNNGHIHAFLQKKYRPKTVAFFKRKNRKYYTYTFLREKKAFLFGRKTCKNIQKIATTALIIVVFITFLAAIFWLYNTLFVTTKAIGIFTFLAFISLVIRDETV